MPKLSAVREARTVEVRFSTGVDEAGAEAEEVLRVTYSRGRFTPEYQRQREAELKDQPEDVKTLNMLADIVSDWDLTDDDDKPIPTTVEAMDKQVPLSVIYRVADAIVGDQSPKKPNSETSDATF